MKYAGSIKSGLLAVNLKYGSRVYEWLLSGLPERCPLCRERAASGFCTMCSASFARVASPCLRCGLVRPVRICPRSGHAWHVEQLFAPYRYASPMDRVIYAMKFHGRRALGRALGLLLTQALLEAPARPDVDALVPVPIHPRRLRERGYNQALEIARPLARALRVPVLTAGIRRCDARSAQIGLTAAGRWSNVARTFSVTRRLAGLRLAVVDDVVTTGATVNALAAELERAGARSMHGWAVARTLPAPVNASGTKDKIEHRAGEHCSTEPGIVEKGLQTAS